MTRVEVLNAIAVWGQSEPVGFLLILTIGALGAGFCIVASTALLLQLVVPPTSSAIRAYAPWVWGRTRSAIAFLPDITLISATLTPWLLIAALLLVMARMGLPEQAF